MNWQPYSTVDWNKPVWLRAPGVDPVLMRWSHGRHQWTGRTFEMMGPIRIWWDLSVCEPAEWAPVRDEILDNADGQDSEVRL